MNNYQKQILDFAIAQIDIDSTPGLPLCCETHKQAAWVFIEGAMWDLLEDKRSGPVLMEQQCLN